jgi:iron complex transport system substrate-binding protein
MGRWLKLSILTFLAVFLVWACDRYALPLWGNRPTTQNQVAPTATQECHPIKHALGETCVPINPQRLVVLNILDNVLALGIQPIGAIAINDGTIATQFPERTQNMSKIGIFGQPNLESILYLKPDLILGTDWNEAIYPQLSKIAPTVLIKTTEDNNWKNWFQQYGDALGKSQEAEKVLNDYQQRVRDFQQQLGNKRSQTQVSIAMFLDGLRIYMNKSFCGGIVQELGLKRPPVQDVDQINKNISLELIPEMAGDVIFLITNNPGDKLRELTDRPLWSQLDAVKNGKVYEVKADVWQNGYGPVAANLILDDIYGALLPK